MWKKWYRTHRILVWLFLAGFGVRAICAIALQGLYGGHAFAAYADAEVYLVEAGNLIEHYRFSLSPEPPLIPDSLRTPVFPLFVALFVFLKLPLLTLVLTHALVAGSICVATYLLAKRLTGSGMVGCLAAVMIALEPLSIYWSNLLMSDTLFSGFFLIGILLFLTQRWRAWALCFGLAALTRPIGVYFFVILLCFEIGRVCIQKDAQRWTTIRALGIATVIFAAIISPWAIRNKIVFDTWSLSSAGWMNLHQITLQEYTEEQGMPFATAMPYPQDAYHFINVPWYKENFTRVVRQDMVGYILFHIRGSLGGFWDHDYDYVGESVLLPKLQDMPGVRQMIWGMVAVGTMGWWVVYLLGVIGIYAIRENLYTWLFVALIGINAVLIGYPASLSGSRFFLPIYPLIFIFAAVGIRHIKERFFSVSHHV